MAYQIVDEKIIGKAVVSDGSFTQMKLMHIICDTAAEIPEPEPAWSAGSRCDILENGGNVYLLSTAREWKPVNFYNRGGDGGDFDPDNYYTKSQTDSIISGKVDKVTGKVLSTEDYTTAEKTKLAGIDDYANYIAVDSVIASASDNPVKGSVIYTALEGKVDKVTGKDLSTEDYTTAEKTKLAGIETGAEMNIQSDWEQSDSTADDFIKNKPTLGSAASRSVVLSLSNADSGLPTSGTVYSALENKVDKVSGKDLSTNDYTTAEKTKLSGLENYDDSAVKSQIGELADAGAKNLLKVNKPTTTVNGITFTVNDDSSITINGTATGGNATFTITDGWSIPTEVGKKYTASLLSGTTDVYMPIYNTSWAGPNVVGSTDFTENSAGGRLARITVKDGTVVDNLTVYPMVCFTEIYQASSAFVPYAPSNYELYKMILALQNQNGG